MQETTAGIVSCGPSGCARKPALATAKTARTMLPAARASKTLANARTANCGTPMSPTAKSGRREGHGTSELSQAWQGRERVGAGERRKLLDGHSAQAGDYRRHLRQLTRFVAQHRAVRAQPLRWNVGGIGF